MSKLIDMIRDGMAKANGNPALEQLGELMSDWVLAHGAVDTDAGNKTLAGAMDAVKAEAQKHQKNGYACMTDAEVLRIALKYAGIEAGISSASFHAEVELPVDDLDLDALLGEV